MLHSLSLSLSLSQFSILYSSSLHLFISLFSIFSIFFFSLAEPESASVEVQRLRQMRAQTEPPGPWGPPAYPEDRGTCHSRRSEAKGVKQFIGIQQEIVKLWNLIHLQNLIHEVVEFDSSPEDNSLDFVVSDEADSTCGPCAGATRPRTLSESSISASRPGVQWSPGVLDGAGWQLRPQERPH